MQILSIVAMEKPRSTKGEDIRDEKVKVLRCIPPIKLEDVVLGQYIGDKSSTDSERQQGYLDDKGVPKDSATPTYAQVVLSINNERWAGVPFILRAGKMNRSFCFRDQQAPPLPSRQSVKREEGRDSHSISRFTRWNVRRRYP